MLEEGWIMEHSQDGGKKKEEVIVSRRKEYIMKVTLRRRITVTSSLHEYPWISWEIGWGWGGGGCAVLRPPPPPVYNRLLERWLKTTWTGFTSISDICFVESEAESKKNMVYMPELTVPHLRSTPESTPTHLPSATPCDFAREAKAKKNIVYGTLYAGADYNLPLCPLHSRLQHISHGQPYARVDLNPLTESTLYPRQGLWIWPLAFLANKNFHWARRPGWVTYRELH